MIDREKVIKGLYAHGYRDCKSCPYWGSGENGKSLCTQLAREALALLKEQERRINELEDKLRLMKYGDQDTLQNGMMPAI